MLFFCKYYLQYKKNHVFSRPEQPQTVKNPKTIQKPNLSKFLKKKDFSHSLKGAFCGLVIVAIAIINLSLFYGLYEHEEKEVSTSLPSKHFPEK
jgi:hypothetical protein